MFDARSCLALQKYTVWRAWYFRPRRVANAQKSRSHLDFNPTGNKDAVNLPRAQNRRIRCRQLRKAIIARTDVPYP